jgi:hypothetical protein
VSLLGEVVALLASRAIPHALIGAAAAAIRGVSRSTFDVDLLVVDPVVLDELTWRPVAAPGIAIEIRRGDADDPLAGVARLEAAGEPRVDLVVGRGGWQRDLLARATRETIDDVTLPVVTVADLALLKLYAGGPQDLWDVAQLLSGPERDSIVRDVEQRIGALPRRCRGAWSKVLRSGG